MNDNEFPIEVKLFMPTNPTEKQVQLALSICDDENTVSDDSGRSNQDKWAHVMHVFNTDTATMFSQIDFTQTYMTDDVRLCEAAGYICDLRRQFLRKLLAENLPNWAEIHVCYMNNSIAQKALSERVRLDRWQLTAKMITKAH